MKRGKKKAVKKWIYFSVILAAVILASFAVYTGYVTTSHTPSQISVVISGQRMTLQQAIDSGDLAKGVLNSSWVTSSYTSSMPAVGHADTDVIITVNAVTMTLRDAINTNVFITGLVQSGFNYAANLPSAGHFGSDINITTRGVKQSLQSGINTKYLACVPSCTGKFTGDSDGCVGTCITPMECVPGSTRTAHCTYQPPCVVYYAPTGKDTCSSAGLWVDGCYRESHVGCGINCWSGHADWQCDGSGNCKQNPSCGSSSSGSTCASQGGSVCDYCSGNWISASDTSKCCKGGCAGGPNQGGGNSGGCFLADAPVLMADGSFKEIKDIISGDIVASYDTETNKFVTSTVGKLITHDGKDSFMNDFSEFPLMSLSVLTNKNLITLSVTENHPFYDPVNKKFKELWEFSIGDKLETIYGEGIILGEKTLIDRASSASEKSTVVYNLEMIKGPTDYLVNGIVVHNGAGNSKNVPKPGNS